jgi:hypothetical protein
LQIIRTGIGIAVVIGRNAAIAFGATNQIDSQAAVREDGITEDGVVNGACATGYCHSDVIWRSTHGAVEGDDVTRAASCAAYGVAVTTDQDAAQIAQGLCAGDVGADDVALDKIALGTTYDHTIVATTAGDQIAGRRTGSGCQAADDVIRDAAIDIHASVWIRQSGCSGYIRANEVALDRAAGSTVQVNPAVVGGDDVTGINGRTADEGIYTGGNNASVRVSQGQRSGNIGADEVALYRVSRTQLDKDGFPDVSRDQVARCRCCAANGVVR